MKQLKFKSKCKISKVDVTEDTLTGRGGVALFVRYLSQVNIYALLVEAFGCIQRSEKGQPIWNIFKQIFCFFYDGTSRHLVYFDQLKRDEGYAAVIENRSEEMICSHQVKRFFKGFSWLCGGYISEDFEAALHLAVKDRETGGDRANGGSDDSGQR